MKQENLANLASTAKHPTWTTLLSQLSVVCAAALGLYAITVNYLITPYIHLGSDAGRVMGVYEGYQRVRDRIDHSQQLILFWGSSMVREGVDCRLLETSYPGLATYNFSVSGDIPYRRLVELPKVRQLHPDCVVIGVSYPEVFESRAPFDDQVAVLPASAYAAMSASARAMLEPKVTAIAQRTAWEHFWWKRKFFFSAMCWEFGVPDRSNPIPPGYTENLKAPFVYTRSVPPLDLKKYLDSRAGYYPPYTSSEVAEPGQSRSGRSLKLIVSELEGQGIRVNLMNMPLNPLLNAAITAPRHAALQNYLESLASPAVQVFDHQNALPAECFTDLVHLNEKGRAAFTGMMGRQLDDGSRPPLAKSSQKLNP
jgi:hypothetical protein